MCHESHVTCHMSHVLFMSSFTAKPGELGSWNFDKKSTSPNLSCVMCHVLCFMCQESHVTSQMSCVMCHLQNTFTAKPLNLGSCNFDRMSTSPDLSHVMSYVSCVTSQLSWVTCHMSHVTWELGSWNVDGKFISPNRPRVMCHVLCFMCQESHVTSEMSCVMCHLQNTFTAKPLELGSWYLDRGCTFPNLVHVKRHHLSLKAFRRWHMTQSSWHMTHDTILVTHDTWHVTGWERWNFCKNFSSPALTVWLWRYFKDDTWHVTRDRWLVTCDKRHMKHDISHVKNWGRWNFCQSFSSLALTVWPWRCFEDDTWKGTFDLWNVTREIWHVTHDTWHMTHDTWHMTHDTWHMTHGTWKVGGGGLSVKISAPYLLQFGSEGVQKIILGKGHSVQCSAVWKIKLTN